MRGPRTKGRPRAAWSFVLAAAVLVLPRGVWDELRLRGLGLLEPAGVAVQQPHRAGDCERCAPLAAALAQTEVARAAAVRALGEAVALYEAAPSVEAPTVLPASVRGGPAAALLAATGGPGRGYRIRIEAGRASGLADGQPVSQAGTLVGRVVAVGERVSEVLLASAPNHRVRVLVVRSQGEERLPAPIAGICRGDGEGALWLRADGLSPDVQQGDRVVVADRSQVAPSGLLLGTVGRVYFDARTGVVEAAVEPAARLDRLDRVLVIRTGYRPATLAGGS